MVNLEGGRLAIPQLTPSTVTLIERLTLGGPHTVLIPHDQGCEALTGEDR